MSLDQLYILPEEVLLIPMNELGEQVKNKFTFEEHDYVLTYTNTRNTSKIVNPDSVSLLKEFRTPRTLIEGVYKYSILNNLDPHQTLEDSYLFLSRLRGEGFLIPYDENAPKHNIELFKKGDEFNDYTIVDKVLGISDTEVYKLRKDNLFFALKVLKTNGQQSHLSDNFYNEIEVLQHLDGVVSPAFVEQGTYNSHHYMIIEWCEGTACDTEAEKYRNFNDPQNRDKLLHICYAIAKAYEHLHTKKVIHSDVHPKNVMVNTQGQVHIIDFGLSKLATSDKQVLRGGMGFFYEPEFAEASMNGQIQPATYLGEQYAIATLLYFLITGKNYINFSLESDKLFGQILSEPPLPFSTFDIEIAPQIEKVLFKALSKKPENRFASMNAFTDALLQAIDNTAPATTTLLELKHSFSSFCQFIKNKYDWESNYLKKGLMLSPTCSVNYGAAGIAYLFYRMAGVENNAELLTLADVWANQAADYIQDESRAFYSADIEITPETVGTISIYHTASGVHLVQALISDALGDYSTYYRSVKNFIEASVKPCDNLDLTLGKSSTLIGCSLLYENATPTDALLLTEIKALGNKTLTEIWNKLNTYPPINDKNPIDYRGIAHGWAGILYATIKWCHQSRNAVPGNLFNRVEQLMDVVIRELNYTRWGITNTDPSSWPGWCHGSAGYTFLWSLLYQFTKEQKFMELAETTARHFMLAEKKGKNGSLCCGMSGEAYALLSLYKITSEDSYLKEAKALAKKVLQHTGNSVMKNNSLYKGEVGAGVLFTELTEAKNSRMPLFE